MGKILVAYFSAGGTTAKLAKAVAEAVGADLFEIRPEKPYTEADLKWTNPFARCNREKFGKKDVPIAGNPDGIGTYDAVLLGFPIWYYGAPNVVESFLRRNDLSGKRVALFATSGGSDIGKTAEKLKPLLGAGAEITGARVFRDADPEELNRWLGSVL